MKIFILLALVGASLCNGFGGVPRPPSGYGSSYGSYGQDGGKEGGGWKGWVGWDNGGNVGSGGNDWGSWGNGGSGGNDWGSWGNGGSGGNGWGSGGDKGGSGGNTGGSDGGKGGHGGGKGSEGHGGGEGSGGHGGSETWSSWSPEKCNSPKPNYKDDKDCMNHALEQFPKLLSSVGGYLCKHKDKKTKWSQEEYEELKSHMETSLGCSGCSLGGILDWKQQLGEVTSGVGKSAAELLPGVEDLAAKLGLAKPVFDLTCGLLGGLLTSECKDKLLGSDVSDLVDNLQGALCKKDKDLDDKQLITTVVRTGCVVSDTVGMDDKTLDMVTKGLSGTLAPLAKAVLALLKGLDVASELLCSLLKTVTSTLGLGSNNGEGGDKGGLLSPVKELLGGVLGGGGDKGKGGGHLQPVNDLPTGGGGSGGGDKGKDGGIFSRLLGK